jgi:hypothetical protein
MTVELPSRARYILEEADLCHVAVRTPQGLHLTPVVFVLHDGLLWLTTSRRSVKRRAWRGDPIAAGLVRHGEAAISFRGGVQTYDALDPVSWPAAAAGGTRLVGAAVRFTRKNARFFAGYAVDARRVPFAWTPPGRVFASIALDAGVVVDLADGVPRERWGRWGSDEVTKRAFAPLGRARGLDLRVPLPVRERAQQSPVAAVALDGVAGPVAFPAPWRRVAGEGAYDAVLHRGLHALAGAGPETVASLTLDEASAWRAMEMRGMLLQGRASAYAPADASRGVRALRRRIAACTDASVEEQVLVRLRPRRVVWWEGWTSGSFTGPS